MIGLATLITGATTMWQFGEPLRWEPEGLNWRRASVLHRDVHLVKPLRYRYIWEETGFRIERAPPSLLDDPHELARFTDTPPVGATFWDAASTEVLGSKTGRIYRALCTVYYTPLESGFTADRGFDMTMETRRGLGGRKYPKSFLRAVTVEGFGKLTKPYNGKRYIKYDGRWGYHDRILGNRNNTLIDLKSAAVHRRSKVFRKNTRMLVLDPTVYAHMGVLEWEVADTGGGLHLWQLDLYWGEDIPLGPGIDKFRPMGCGLAMKFWIPVLVNDG